MILNKVQLLFFTLIMIAWSNLKAVLIFNISTRVTNSLYVNKFKKNFSSLYVNEKYKIQ